MRVYHWSYVLGNQRKRGQALIAWITVWFAIIAYYWLAFLFQGVAVAVGLWCMWKMGMIGGGDPNRGSESGPDTLDEQKKQLKKWRK